MVVGPERKCDRDGGIRLSSRDFQVRKIYGSSCDDGNPRRRYLVVPSVLGSRQSACLHPAVEHIGKNSSYYDHIHSLLPRLNHFLLSRHTDGAIDRSLLSLSPQFRVLAPSIGFYDLSARGWATLRGDVYPKPAKYAHLHAHLPAIQVPTHPHRANAPPSHILQNACVLVDNTTLPPVSNARRGVAMMR